MTWRAVAARTVGADRRVPVPDRVRPVFFDGPATGDEQVFWSVGHGDGSLLVSDTPVRGDAYELVADTTVYERAPGDYRLRPPSSVPSNLRAPFVDGGSVVFLVTAQMAADRGPQGAFLASRRRAGWLLRDGVPIPGAFD